MYDHTTISISQIANGFLVRLPYIEKPYDQEAEVIRLTRLSKKVAEEDTLLAELQEQNKQQPKQPGVLDLKDDRVQYCKDFKAVLALLAKLEQ